MDELAARPDFWGVPEQAAAISEELADLKKNIGELEDLETELDLLEEAGGEEDIDLAAEKIEKKEELAFLSGKYDRQNAILTIHSGAGGQGAQDWGAMLLRMYSRYCQRQGFKSAVIDESFGDGVNDGLIGYKEVSLHIRGPRAYGYLKKENGVQCPLAKSVGGT